MKGSRIIGFMAVYVASVALAVWINVAVLCMGDTKFDRGCGGVEIYLLFWLVAALPMPLTCVLFERRQPFDRASISRFGAYLLGVVAVLEIGWFADVFGAFEFGEVAFMIVVAIVGMSLTRNRRRRDADLN